MITSILEKSIYSYFELHQINIWADPDIVLTTVSQQLANLRPAKINDPQITIGTWNAEFLWQAKANHFIESYKQIAERHHLLALQEVSPAALSIIGSICGYNHFVCRPNSRGQAVGFLVHPRLQVINVQEYKELANIDGIGDLRPALQIDVYDSQTNMTLSAITIHLKSMLGGLAQTSIIRKVQLEKLTSAINNIQNPIIVLGDFNCLLDLTDDTQPLFDNGFAIVNPNNHTSTQSLGGRLDGLFYKNLADDQLPKHYSIRNFWRASLAGRSLSDHGLLTWKLANG